MKSLFFLCLTLVLAHPSAGFDRDKRIINQLTERKELIEQVKGYIEHEVRKHSTSGSKARNLTTANEILDIWVKECLPQAFKNHTEKKAALNLASLFRFEMSQPRGTTVSDEEPPQQYEDTLLGILVTLEPSDDAGLSQENRNALLELLRGK